MSPLEQAWLILKRENFAFLPRIDHGDEWKKSGYGTMYEHEELRDVNEALRQIGVVPDGLVAEYANYGPSVNRQSPTSAPDRYTKPHQYLPYRTKEEREGFKFPTFYVSDPETGEKTINRPYSGPTVQDLIDARSRRA